MRVPGPLERISERTLVELFRKWYDVTVEVQGTDRTSDGVQIGKIVLHRDPDPMFHAFAPLYFIPDRIAAPTLIRNLCHLLGIGFEEFEHRVGEWDQAGRPALEMPPLPGFPN